MGSGEMAEAGRKYMLGQKDQIKAMSGDDWDNDRPDAHVGVRLDVRSSGEWSMVKHRARPAVGDRMPILNCHGSDGKPVGCIG